MKIILNETERKPLAALLGEYTNTRPQYLRAPSYGYQIGDLLLTREGNIESPDTLSQAEFDELLALLDTSGYCPKETDFHPAQEPEAEATSTEETGLTIPLENVNVRNLTNLLDAKGFLIKHALHIDDLRFELKNVHAAKLTRSEDGSFTYAKPKAIPGAVSISLDAEGDSSPFYADGIVYFRSTANNGYSGDLEIALIPEWFRTEILKEELDNNGVLIENATITELEKFALLFEFDGDVRSIRHVLYNCTSSRPSIESETKEDTIEPGKEKLTLTADPREDGLVKSRTGDATDAEIYKNWYQQVYVPVPKTEG